jgi:hypothetical protein
VVNCETSDCVQSRVTDDVTTRKSQAVGSEKRTKTTEVRNSGARITGFDSRRTCVSQTEKCKVKVVQKQLFTETLLECIYSVI